MKFTELTREEQDWLDAYLDGTIGPEEFVALEDRMAGSKSFREVMRRYLALDHDLQFESGAEETGPWKVDLIDQSDSRKSTPWWQRSAPVAGAATVAFLLGLGTMYWSRDSGAIAGGSVAGASEREALGSGFAVIENLFDAKWQNSEKSHHRGDVLGAEVFQLASGTAEIQFFSGAVMTLEGPAEITLNSAWEATCHEGAIRMKVPPAARGFVLQAPSTEIVDLGTEFGLLVRGGKGKVEVFDGEITMQHRGSDRLLVRKGGAFDLLEDGPAVAIQQGNVPVPDARNFGDRAEKEIRTDFEKWQEHRDRLARDKRLLAYYSFDDGITESSVSNLALPHNAEFDGSVIMAEPVAGRWPGHKSALEFHRPGSRVRVNLPGEFAAFTFMCWVRIDSLDRQYNALLMADSYETGEPHWQIREDGEMMLSVMVDDQRPNPRVVDSAGHHRVYFSTPMWDLSMSGQWLHLTSVFDPAGRTVRHFVDGKRISEQLIEQDYFIDRLRIGNAEIGNWGLPFREDPKFAIRNLNGRMDELAVFKAALSDEEIRELYLRSRSDQR